MDGDLFFFCTRSFVYLHLFCKINSAFTCKETFLCRNEGYCETPVKGRWPDSTSGPQLITCNSRHTHRYIHPHWIDCKSTSNRIYDPILYAETISGNFDVFNNHWYFITALYLIVKCGGIPASLSLDIWVVLLQKVAIFFQTW